MIERKASIVVSDDLYQFLTGKITISGVYTGDIVIPGPEFIVQQLVFFFLIEGPLEDPFRSIGFKILLPGGALTETGVTEVPTPAISDPRRNRMVFKLPILVPRPILRPGRIETTVVHEKGEIDAGGIWVVDSTAQISTIA